MEKRCAFACIVPGRGGFIPWGRGRRTPCAPQDGRPMKLLVKGFIPPGRGRVGPVWAIVCPVKPPDTPTRYVRPSTQGHQRERERRHGTDPPQPPHRRRRNRRGCHRRRQRLARRRPAGRPSQGADRGQLRLARHRPRDRRGRHRRDPRVRAPHRGCRQRRHARRRHRRRARHGLHHLREGFDRRVDAPLAGRRQLEVPDGAGS